VCHLEALSSALPPAVAVDTDASAFVNSLLDLRRDPGAMGEEALRFLAGMGWIECGVVRMATDGGAARVVCSYLPRSCGTGDSKAGYQGRLPIRIALGSKQARHYELLLSPERSDMSMIACGGIVRLIDALATSKLSEERSLDRTRYTDSLETAGDESGLFLSPSMLSLVASAKRVAPLDITILLTGESGTGKEIIANLIHRASGRPPSSFVAFNCATVPRDMVDSQLFGYRRGAFTGAVQSFKGVISSAEGGTLFLDEIGELPLETQPKLLRFLDSGEIQRLGEAIPQRVSVRVLAATNADLEKLMKQGRFREDLYYRLNVVHFRVPPLRERRDEIGPLAERFLTKSTEEFGKFNIKLSDETMEHLLLFTWPGNVRQLWHEMCRLAALHDSDSVIDVCDLSVDILGKAEAPTHSTRGDSMTMTVRLDGRLADMISQVEKEALSHSISVSGGRLDLAAKRLGLSRKGLYLKRQRLGFMG